MLVVVDKFTKWIEYKPIVKILYDRAVDFISDIIHRFGFPHTIITDLGSNLRHNLFGISVTTPASKSSMLQSHILGQIVKLSVSMV